MISGAASWIRRLSPVAMPGAAGILALILLSSESFPAWARFVAFLLFLVHATLSWRSGDKVFLTSPPYLLGAIIVVFYSLLPAAYGPSVLSGKAFGTYLEKPAERFILVFALCALIAHLAFTSHRNRSFAESDDLPRREWRLSALVAIVFGIATVSLGALEALPLFRHLVVPVGLFLSIFVFRRFIGRGWPSFLVCASFVTIVAALLLRAGEGKIVVVLLGATLAYGLRLTTISARRAAVTALAMAVILIATIQTFQVLRYPPGSLLNVIRPGQSTLERADQLMTRFNEVIRWKVVIRQMETGDCFGRVVATHKEEPFLINRQGFWISVLIPRILWPEKPNFSRGQDYAKRYCGIPNPEANNHSASITLLGQPVIYGGLVGLVPHGGLLLLALGAVARAGRNPRSAAAVWSVAMLPWLIDFDQDFALYVGNAVKFGMIMAALSLGFHLLERTIRRKTPSEAP